MRGRPFLVRRARPDELGDAAALFQRVATETLDWLPPDRLTAACFLRQAESERVFVAFAGSRLVAVAALYEPEAFLHSLYVEREWQGRGVGTALLAAVSEAAGRPLSLKVEERNSRARTFYSTRGFTEGERSEEGGSVAIRLSRP